MMARTVRLWKPAEKWRYRCPAGHAGWEVEARAIYCQSCAEQGLKTTYHRTLVDVRTDKEVPLSEVEFLTLDDGEPVRAGGEV